MMQISDKSILNHLHKITPTISVGILTADLLSLGRELTLLENAGVKLLHIDVMDGCFTPRMTFGPLLIKAMQTSLFKDVHLMIEEPLEKLADYVVSGADMITVHLESSRHIHRVLQNLGTMNNVNDPERGLLRGIALNPGTDIELIKPIIDEVDMILLLAVNPGWSGQKFISSTQRRLANVSKMIRRSGRNILLGVDGGINRGNITNVACMGADIIVTGSAVFDGKAPAENVYFILEKARAAKKSI